MGLSRSGSIFCNPKFLVVLLLSFISASQYAILIPALWPFLHHKFGSNAIILGVAISIYSLASMIMSPIVSKLYHHRFFVSQILVLFTLMSLGNLLYSQAEEANRILHSGGPIAIIVGRFLLGMGSAVSVPLQAWVGEYGDSDEQQTAATAVSSMWSAGFAVGPFLGGLCGPIKLTLHVGEYAIYIDRYTSPAYLGVAMNIVASIAALTLLRKTSEGDASALLSPSEASADQPTGPSVSHLGSVGASRRNPAGSVVPPSSLFAPPQARPPPTHVIVNDGDDGDDEPVLQTRATLPGASFAPATPDRQGTKTAPYGATIGSYAPSSLATFGVSVSPVVRRFATVEPHDRAVAPDAPTASYTVPLAGSARAPPHQAEGLGGETHIGLDLGDGPPARPRAASRAAASVTSSRARRGVRRRAFAQPSVHGDGPSGYGGYGTIADEDNFDQRSFGASTAGERRFIEWSEMRVFGGGVFALYVLQFCSFFFFSAEDALSPPLLLSYGVGLQGMGFFYSFFGVVGLVSMLLLIPIGRYVSMGTLLVAATAAGLIGQAALVNVRWYSFVTHPTVDPDAPFVAADAAADAALPMLMGSPTATPGGVVVDDVAPYKVFFGSTLLLAGLFLWCESTVAAYVNVLTDGAVSQAAVIGGLGVVSQFGMLLGPIVSAVLLHYLPHSRFVLFIALTAVMATAFVCAVFLWWRQRSYFEDYDEDDDEFDPLYDPADPRLPALQSDDVDDHDRVRAPPGYPTRGDGDGLDDYGYVDDDDGSDRAPFGSAFVQ